MKSDLLLQATADAFNWDYNELYALKYELDQHTYYFGQHYRNPRETSTNRISIDQFRLNAIKISQIAELLTKNPDWMEHIVTSQAPTVVMFNYNYGNWAAALHQEGYCTEPPLWHGFQTDNAFIGLLQSLCTLLKEMLFSDFKLLMSDEFRNASWIVKQILRQYYDHPRFKALFIPYSVSFLEYTAVDVFKALGKPTFVFEHGIPGAYAPENALFPDYTIVWGEQVKKNYLQRGVSPDKILMAGHPTYQSYTPARLRFDIDDVLVCTWPISGAPACDMACNQNRGHILYYLFTIQIVLKKLGVQRARLRPHPSESCEWYMRFVDTDFYQLDQEPLPESLKVSTLVIGSASTVFIESMYYGVNYIVYNLDAFDIENFCYRDLPPFNGADPRIPVAKNPSELEQFILYKKGIDPSCFADYISTPFNPNLIINKIKEHQGSSCCSKKFPQMGLTEYDLEKIPENTKCIIGFVKPYTMATSQRAVNVVKAIDYIVENNIPGAFVECGVWRGGCSMAAACELLIRNASDRELFLYDTYEGMPPPTEDDILLETGASAESLLSSAEKNKDSHYWCYAPIDDVTANLKKTSYPINRLHFVKGKVEETIPNIVPESIAVLRLDTDWYESTSHELHHLYPRLSCGGVLIIDDYGCWAGSRKAVDEYFAGLAQMPVLIKIDDDFGSTAYYCIKPPNIAEAETVSNCSSSAGCPVTGLKGRQTSRRDPEELVAAYENYLGAPLPVELTKKYFQSIVHEYECAESGIRWYAPGIVAEEDFYETLAQIYPWYYRDEAWDKDVACSILKGLSAQNFVEYGCGNGSFLRQAAKHGIEGFGVDISEQAIRECIKQGFTAVQLNDVDQFQFVQSDVLVMLQTIEHVEKPVEFLTSILDRFPAKILVISAPSYEALLGYTRDPLSWPPHHFTAWSEKGFESLAEKIGYTVQATVSEPLTLQRLEGMLAMEKSRSLRELPTFPEGTDCSKMLAQMQGLGKKWALYSHSILCVMARK